MIVRGRCEPASIERQVTGVTRAGSIGPKRESLTCVRCHPPSLFPDGSDPVQGLVLTRIVGPDARLSGIVAMVTTALRGSLRFAPALAERRGARRCDERQNDGKERCSKHSQLAVLPQQEQRHARTPAVSRFTLGDRRVLTASRHPQGGSFAESASKIPQGLSLPGLDVALTRVSKMEIEPITGRRSA